MQWQEYLLFNKFTSMKHALNKYFFISRRKYIYLTDYKKGVSRKT